MDKMLGSASRLAGLAGVAAASVLVACGGGGGGGAPQGTLKVSMTDQPACYESVLVTVEKVRVHTGSSAEDASGGWEEILPPNGPVQVDLLNLTNGALVDLGAAQVDAGAYSQLRLVLAENSDGNPLANAVRPVGGTLVPLRTPSAQQSGLKIRGDFSVPAGGTTELLLDFDACKSVVVAGNSGQFILKPVVRLSPKFTGAVHGYVSTTLSLDGTTVSAQQDGTIVRSTKPDAQGFFNLAYLPPGSYTVVVTSIDRATGVVSSVPVDTAATVLNDAASAIALPASATSTVSGSVKAGAAAVGDATVTATQALSTGTIEVAAAPVDFELATYTLTLPVAAPVRAPYAASGFVFTEEAAAAGLYTLVATAPGRAALAQPADVRTGPATVNFAY